MESGYKKFAVIIIINTGLMFLLTYTMIAEPGHFVFSINKLYMALIMVAAMNIVMLTVMRSMFKDKKKNFFIYGVLVIILGLSFAFLRTQTPVGDQLFLRSMIPHHSAAILICERARLSDPEVITLCEQIIEAQREEIAQMQEIIERTR